MLGLKIGGGHKIYTHYSPVIPIHFSILELQYELAKAQDIWKVNVQSDSVILRSPVLFERLIKLPATLCTLCVGVYTVGLQKLGNKELITNVKLCTVCMFRVNISAPAAHRSSQAKWRSSCKKTRKHTSPLQRVLCFGAV